MVIGDTLLCIKDLTQFPCTKGNARIPYCLFKKGNTYVVTEFINVNFSDEIGHTLRFCGTNEFFFRIDEFAPSDSYDYKEYLVSLRNYTRNKKLEQIQNIQK